MRALTLTQPWAGLVASGVKLVENRPRKMIKREDFGKPFAIHASRVFDRYEWHRIIAIAPELAIDYPGPMAPGAHARRFCELTSAVIAVATIDGEVVDRIDRLRVRHWAERMSEIAEDQRRWFFGPIGYVLRDVRPLAQAVPCRGWQGFWTLPADVERKVMEQLR